VTFAYRDRKDGNRRKELTISADEFIRRFLLHVVPRGMPRTRHYGILSNRNKTVYLPVCRALLGVPEPVKTEAPVERVARSCLPLPTQIPVGAAATAARVA